MASTPHGMGLGVRRRRPRATALSAPIKVRLGILFAGAVWMAKGQEEDWWKPAPGVNWDWQLEGVPTTVEGVEMYDIDLFDVPKSVIQELRDDGVIVICYFSAGTYEEWRADEGDFPRSALGNRAYDGEWWINIEDEGIKNVMEARLDLAVSKGCDGVEPDQLEVYTTDSGWSITSDDQITYNTWIAEQAHNRNLSVGLKNDWAQVEELQPLFDWALGTNCVLDNFCTNYSVFYDNGKAVFDAEFSMATLDFCDDEEIEFVDVIVKSWDLNEQRCSCTYPETSVNCQELLSANGPTPSPSFRDEDSESASVDAEDADGGASTWVIVTAIAVVVLVVMAVGTAYNFRNRTLEKSAVDGVDDFTAGARTSAIVGSSKSRSFGTWSSRS